MCVHVLEWLDVRLFTLCVLPYESAEWRTVLCLILGGWCGMRSGFWLHWRCDVYLCLWGIDVTDLYNWPKLMTEALVTAKSPHWAAILPYKYCMCRCFGKLFNSIEPLTQAHSVFKVWESEWNVPIECLFISLSNPNLFRFSSLT